METLFQRKGPAAGGGDSEAGRPGGGAGAEGGGWGEEEVTVGCLRLVLAHGEVGHVPPAELRRFIREALARFPCRFVRVVAVRVAPRP